MRDTQKLLSSMNRRAMPERNDGDPRSLIHFEEVVFREHGASCHKQFKGAQRHGSFSDDPTS